MLKCSGAAAALPKLISQSWSCLAPLSRHLRRVGLLVLLLLLCGCAGSRARKASFERSFQFGEDTFCYRNDLAWVYYHDPDTGAWKHRKREPTPDYKQHCFVVARAARQFFQHASFEPSQPVADEKTYRRLVQRVISTSPRHYLTPCERITIPGYSNLFEFSKAHEQLLKDECGGAWQSYFQRGHWRMIFPFSRNHQALTVEQLQESLRRNRPVIIHLVSFPSLAINHAGIVFDMEETTEEVRFLVYDPYDPLHPAPLTFNRCERSFHYPANDYFAGGCLDIYEVYHAWNY